VKTASVSPPNQDRRALHALPWAVVVATIALLPWWRNHTYLRDFYDYGLVIAGNARILAGERPYADFATPIQSGMFLANLGAERVFGGTFLAMTWGAAVAITMAAVGFTLLLARRWPGWVSALVTAGVMAGSLSQHTILWHNAIGVVCLAAVAWSCAVAPVLRREHWAWHAIAAAGLVAGGINKLNFHLLAIAVASGWAIREWTTVRAERRRCVLSLLWIVLAGVVAPAAIELAWTRASFGAWWYNVVILPLTARGSDLLFLFSWSALWHPVHNYYGTLSVQPVGMFCLVTTVGAAAAAWRSTSSRASPGVLVVGSGVLAAAGSLALLATNYEIAYVAWAAAVVLAASIWLGFGAAPRGWLFLTTLVAPAIILTGAAWESAWRGQRSQFGHAGSPRATYSDAGKVGTAFGYLKGLRIPPEWAQSLLPLEETLPLPRADGTRAVFYGQGLEWLERAFPAVKHKGVPLWMHIGTSYGPRETRELISLLADEGQITAYYVAIPWKYLPEAIAAALRQRYDFSEFSAYLGHWTRKVIIDPPPDSRNSDGAGANYRPLGTALGSDDNIYLINLVGGSMNPLDMELRGRAVTVFPRTEHSAPVVGVSAGWGYLRVGGGVRRLQGEAVGRTTEPGAEALAAKFAVRAADSGITLWSGEVRLEGSARERVIPFIIHGDGKPLELVVEVPKGQTGKLEAGFRQLFIQQTDIGSIEPPRLRPNAPPDERPDPRTLREIFPGGTWRLSEAVVRGAVARVEGLWFPPGAELWFKPDRPMSEVSGEFRRAPSDAPGNPVLRLVWCKGGHLELLQQEGLSAPDARIVFRGWSPEPDGWFGLLVDPGSTSAPAMVKFTATAP
jgi:hypothetical protein